MCVCVFPTDSGAASAPGAPHRPHARPVHPHTVPEALPAEGAHAAGCAPEGVIVQQRSGQGTAAAAVSPFVVCVCVLHSASCNPLQCGTNATRTASPAVAAAASQSTPQPEQSCVCWTFAGQTILRQGQEVSDIHFVMHGSVHLTYSAALAQAAARAAARNSSGGGLPPGAARLSSGGWPAAAAAGTDGGPRASSAGRFSGLALALKLEQSCFDPPVVLATRCVACRAQLLGSVPERPRGCWPGWQAT